MKVLTATSTTSEMGLLTKRVYAFIQAQTRAIEAGISSPSDWEPVAECIDPQRFKRIGAYLEELNWEGYKKFLTGWMSGGTRFEMTEFCISEIGNTVFQEIEERHYRGEEFIRKNVVAIYRFNEEEKLVRLDIYEQAKDSGDWIIEAANSATAKNKAGRSVWSGQL